MRSHMPLCTLTTLLLTACGGDGERGGANTPDVPYPTTSVSRKVTPVLAADPTGNRTNLNKLAPRRFSGHSPMFPPLLHPAASL